MLVECWSHAGQVMTNIRPLVTENWKASINLFIKWGMDKGNSYILIPVDQIDAWKNVLVLIGQTLSGQPKTDIITVINFLNTLNKFNPPERYSTKEGCIAHEHDWKNGKCVLKYTGVFPPPPPKPEDIKNETDCKKMNWYWYNNACHVSPALPGNYKTKSECEAHGYYWYYSYCHADPQAIPLPPKPEDFKDKSSCEAYAFYWYDGKCNRYPEEVIEPPLPIPGANQFLVYAGHLDEYLKTLGLLQVIERGIVVLLRNWLLLIGNFLIWLEKRST